jgi:DNA adenine methylase
MTDDQHRELASVLHGVKARVALSGYQCSLLDELYKDWYRTTAPAKHAHSIKQLREETLWTNYDPHKQKWQHQQSFWK